MRNKVSVVTGVIVLILIIAFVSIGSSSQKQGNQSPTPIPLSQELPSDLHRYFPDLEILLSGDNKDGQPKLKQFQYFPDAHESGVDLNMTIEDTASQTKDELKREIADCYIAMYHGKVSVNVATVDAWGPIQDKYGNRIYQVVAKTRLDSNIANKINWNADKATLETQIIPGLWTLLFSDPSLGWQ